MRRRVRDRAGRAALVTATVAYVGLLLVAPFAALLASALARGPRAALAALASADALHALGVSLVLAAIAVGVNGVVGTLVAWVLTRDRFRGRGLLNALVDMPFAVSPVVVGLALVVAFGPRGFLAPLLHGVGLVYALPGMALATVFVSFPFVAREVGLVLAEAGLDQEEAAFTLGAGPLTTFLRVTLPNIRWGLVTGVLLVTARALGEFGAVLVVSGGIVGLTESGTLFVFRALDERRETAAYTVSLALAGLSIALIALVERLKRRAR